MEDTQNQKVDNLQPYYYYYYYDYYSYCCCYYLIGNVRVLLIHVIRKAGENPAKKREVHKEGKEQRK